MGKTESTTISSSAISANRVFLPTIEAMTATAVVARRFGKQWSVFNHQL